MIRSYLSHLNLLLVARVSAVIITVIAIIGLLGFSYRFGLNADITFFPMIILSWTIERMSILWRGGAREVLIRRAAAHGGLGLFAMNNPWCATSPSTSWGCS